MPLSSVPIQSLPRESSSSTVVRLLGGPWAGAAPLDGDGRG